MKDFERIFSGVREAVEKKLTASPGCHDLDHTLRVLANARMLAAKIPEADSEIVELAALLHDIARPEELASQGRVCHAAAGAKIAEKLLLELGAPPESAARVAAAVRSHRYRDEVAPETPEARIVSARRSHSACSQALMRFAAAEAACCSCFWNSRTRRAMGKGFSSTRRKRSISSRV